MRLFPHLVPIGLLALVGCNDVDHPDHHHHEQELITTVELLFTPTTSEESMRFTWSDPEQSGSPTIEPIVLNAEATYSLAITFLNGLEDPPEDFTDEIQDEADEHQVFITGSAVTGPATADNTEAIVSHAYDDADPNGNPLGLVNTIAGIGTGEGELIVTLRHLPLEDGQAVKTADLAAEVAGGGFSQIGGDNDAQVTFPLSTELP